ncbi:MAG: CapA family protein [Bacteroidota bacterium]
MRLLLQHVAFALFFAFAATETDKPVLVTYDSSISDTLKVDTLKLDTIKVDTIGVDSIDLAADSLPVLGDTIALNVQDSLMNVDTTPVIEYVSVIGVGDMMLGTNYPSPSYLPIQGGKFMLSDMEQILKNADVTVGNLEGTLLDGEGEVKRCRNPELCYAFRSPESYGLHFAKAGFDLLSLANNHSGDFGLEGRDRTKATLDELGILYAGLAKTDETVIFEKDGIKYGFCAFSPNKGTCDIRDLPRAKQLVEQLAEESDIVIVSFHGGAEGKDNQRVTRKTETYYGENRGNVHAFSHAVIDAGADVVFGHGPHVTRAAELYKDRFIIYSLGNFCTYGRFNLRDVAGYAPVVRLKLKTDGTFVEGDVIPIYQRKSHGPKIDPQQRAVIRLMELTKADFPETDLRIDVEGKLGRKSESEEE